jgi:membrane-associated phospholipid phosphatase
VLTAAVGGTVAAERVLAGHHFYSDVAVGALAGFAVGALVLFLHERGSVAVGPGSVSFSKKF